MSFASMEQEHNGFNVPWKLCLNLCSLRWLKPTRRRVGFKHDFKPETSLVPKVLFEVVRIKPKSALEILNMKSLGRLSYQVCSIL